MLTYRQILSKAAQVAWQNPSLWFFGLFTAFIGSGGEIEILLRSSALGSDQGIIKVFISNLAGGLKEAGLLSLVGLKGLVAALIGNPLYFFIAIILLIIALSIVVSLGWLIIVSQGALISGVHNVIQNKRSGWSQIFSSGIVKFWPVMILAVLAKIIFWLLFIILGFFTYLNSPGLDYIFFIIYVIFSLAILIISFVIKYAICGVVLKNQPIGDALESAVKLFYKNWLLSLEVAVILFLIYSAAMSLISFFTYLIFTYLVIIFHSSLGLVLFIGGLSVIFIIYQILLAIFHWTAWVIVFEILTNKKNIMLSRLINGWQKIFD